MVVTLIDYGVGNIRAFANVFERLGVATAVAKSAEHIEQANKLVLPGVGAFDWAMTRLNASGMRDALDRQVLQRNVPVLGVCVGMQMMANASDEGSLKGLGWINAHVAKFTNSGDLNLPLPHMGWNDATPHDTTCLFAGLADPRFYFLHSYVVAPADPADILATSSYGNSFVSAVRRGNIFGTQFHPEKSHQWGISLLANFAGI